MPSVAQGVCVSLRISRVNTQEYGDMICDSKVETKLYYELLYAMVL